MNSRPQPFKVSLWHIVNLLVSPFALFTIQLRTELSLAKKSGLDLVFASHLEILYCSSNVPLQQKCCIVTCIPVADLFLLSKTFTLSLMDAITMHPTMRAATRWRHTSSNVLWSCLCRIQVDKWMSWFSTYTVCCSFIEIFVFIIWHAVLYTPSILSPLFPKTDLLISHQPVMAQNFYC